MRSFPFWENLRALHNDPFCCTLFKRLCKVSLSLQYWLLISSQCAVMLLVHCRPHGQLWALQLTSFTCSPKAAFLCPQWVFRRAEDLILARILWSLGQTYAQALLCGLYHPSCKLWSRSMWRLLLSPVQAPSARRLFTDLELQAWQLKYFGLYQTPNSHTCPSSPNATYHL